MNFKVNSKRWWIGRGPVRHAWQARWNRWLLNHDPERQARIAQGRADFRAGGGIEAARRWLDR